MHLLERHFDIALETPSGLSKLRKLILFLAINGKFNTQNIKDEPVIKLLERIKSIKRSLLTENKNSEAVEIKYVPSIRKLHELPIGWEWVNMEMICHNITSGSTPPKEIFSSAKGIPFLKVYNIRDQKIDFNYKSQFISPQYHKNHLKRSTLYPGDVVMNIVGPPLGKIAVIPNDYKEWNCNQAIVFFRPIVSELTPYIYKYLSEGSFLKFIELIGTAGQDNISISKSRNIYLPLPPLAEQKRIVAKIDQLMALCDKLEAERDERNSKRRTIHSAAVNNLLTAKKEPEFAAAWTFIAKNFGDLYGVSENVADLKKAILQLAVMGKLVPQNPKDQPASELLKEIEAEKQRLMKAGKIKKQEPLAPIKPEEMQYDLPKGWEWTSIKNICEIRTGATPRSSSKEYYGGQIKWLVSGDIHKELIFDCKGRITDAGLENSNCKILPVDSVLIALNGQGKTRATVAILKTEAACNQSLASITPHFQKKIISKYLYWNLKGRYYAIRDITGQHQRRGLNLKIVGDLVITLPPLAEQKRIVAKVDELLSLCDRLEKQLEESSEKQSAVLNAVLAKVA